MTEARTSGAECVDSSSGNGRPRRLMSDPARLRRCREELQQTRKSRRLGVEEIEALAECNFRLALHPETSLAEAVESLGAAVRYDGANPRYAYHLARLYFVHGELGLAASWLQLAVQLCPTSHRLWTHVSLLQQALNARYKNDVRYQPDDLKTKGEQIAGAILKGTDSFKAEDLTFVPRKSDKLKEEEKRRAQAPSPPEASGESPPDGSEDGRAKPKAHALSWPAVRRMTNAGKCRWSGVADLAVERLLEANPTERGLKALLPLLENAADAVATRPGGAAAFSILSVQWLIAGYPVATVRRLLVRLTSAHECASLKLLDLVRSLFEAPVAELPRLLAEALVAGRLPPLLAAVIHARRLLIRPLEFRSLGAYRAANKLLARLHKHRASAEDGDAAKQSADEADALVQRLVRAVETLYPKPSESLADKPPQAKRAEAVRDGPALMGEFERLEQMANQLDAVREQAWAFLKQKLEASAQAPADADAYAQVAADHAAFGKLVAAIHGACEHGGQARQAMTDAIGTLSDRSALPKDLQDRHDALKKRFPEIAMRLNKFREVLNRVATRLAADRERFPADQRPATAELGSLLVAVESLSPVGPPAASDETAAPRGDRVAELRRIAKEFSEKLEVYWRDVVALGNAAKQRELTVEEISKLAEIAPSAEHVFNSCREALAEIGAMRSGGNLSPASVEDIDAAEKEFQGIGSRRGPFANRLKALPVPKAASPSSAPAAKETSKPVLRTAPQMPPPPHDSASSKLRTALAYTNREIDKVFAEAWETFAAYPPWARLLPPIHALRSTVRGRQAETLFRLGRRQEARRVWNAMLGEDRLDVDVLRNLAVCDTGASDPGLCLRSWQAYLEVLYSFDLLAGRPRPHAQQRAEFHRAFSHSYAPQFLFEKLSQEWVDSVAANGPALVAFLGNPARIGSFVEHKMLEFFNARLQFTSPTLILGVSRAEKDDVRKKALEALPAFHRKLRAGLPSRLNDAFLGLADKHVDQAYAACSSAKRLTQKKDPNYAMEHAQLLRLISEFCELKLKLHMAIGRAENLAAGITSAESLTQLVRLDELPIGLCREMLMPVASRFGTNPDELVSLMKKSIEPIVVDLIKQALAPARDASDARRRHRQYRLLVDDLIRHPAAEKLGQLLDSPHRVPAICSAILEDTSEEALRPTLERWHRDCPELAGVALDLARFLLQQGKTEEAVGVLRTAATHGFHAPSREMCIKSLAGILEQLGQRAEAKQLLDQLAQSKPPEERGDLESMSKQMRCQEAVDDERYDEALRLSLELLAEDDRQPKLAQNVVVIFVDAAKKDRKDPGHRPVMEGITAWLQRAEARRKAQEEEPEEEREPAVSAEVLQQLAALRDEGVVQGLVAAHASTEGTLDGTKLIPDLDKLLQSYPDVADAYYYRMIAWWQRASAAAQPGQSKDLKQCLPHVAQDAKRVIEKSRKESQRADAKKLQAQAKELDKELK